MDDSLQSGFSVTGPCDGSAALIMTSPHSGREYPPHFIAASRLPLFQLRRAEDAMVDQLLGGVDCAPVLRARYARTFLDLNRAPDEVDPAMFYGPLSLPVQITDRVTAGLGVLPKIASNSQEIYATKIDPGEAAARINGLHRPWHDRIATLIERARHRHGYAILIDCHSMPTPVGMRPPQIILGDRHGTTAHPALVRLIERHFSNIGWRVAFNAPYAGGYTTVHHGAVAAGVHAIQIEIDRALYLNPATLEPGPGFARVAAAMTALAGVIIAAAPGLPLGVTPLREAAE